MCELTAHKNPSINYSSVTTPIWWLNGTPQCITIISLVELHLQSRCQFKCSVSIGFTLCFAWNYETDTLWKGVLSFCKNNIISETRIFICLTSLTRAKPKEKNEICCSISTCAVKCDGVFFVLQHGFQYGFQHA